MNQDQIKIIVEKQRNFFSTGKTLDYKFRKEYLIKLYKAIKENIPLINEGLYKDLGKSASESYMCEIGLVLSEITYMLKHMKKFSKPRRVRTPLAQYISKSFELASPYGSVLVMSPWNYPFLLSMDPIVEAVAAGNVVLLKTSEFSFNTNQVIKRILESVFPLEYVACVFGGYEENTILIHTKFDYIFFTGSKRVGNIVYQNASMNNTPVTLELGGKSPCIVDKSAKIKLAARRIVFGKLLNVGQTCVAPDYFLVHKDIKEKFIEAIKKEIERQYTSNPLNNEKYGKIITMHHFERVCGLIDTNKVIYGGGYDRMKLKIEPTILDNVTFNDRVMQEEIFGPIFPIIEYEDLDECIKKINSMDAPLACYIYSTTKKNINKVIYQTGFGGGCINDCIIHLASSYLRFGGFKESGIGSYHGARGFETFSHYKSIVDKKNIIDLPMRYQPYKKMNDKLVKMFLK
ncbi:MAG: aldehyde dehydrogenase [Anaeroplasmataceae bacterium]